MSKDSLASRQQTLHVGDKCYYYSQMQSFAEVDSKILHCQAVSTGTFATAHIDFIRNRLDPISGGIECFEKSGLGVTHLRTKLFESISFHKKGNFHCAVITPKPDAMSSGIETTAWVREVQFH